MTIYGIMLSCAHGSTLWDEEYEFPWNAWATAQELADLEVGLQQEDGLECVLREEDTKRGVINLHFQDDGSRSDRMVYPFIFTIAMVVEDDDGTWTTMDGRPA